MKEILSLCRKSGITDPEIIRLKGDYSDRMIYRVNYDKGSVIAVSGGNIPENEAFLSFRDTFEMNGFNVPAFISVSEDHKHYLIEDLGDVTVKSYCDMMIKENNIYAVRSIYKKIVRQLPELQIKLYDKIDYSKCYQSDVFDTENMKKDIRRFEEYYLKKFIGKYDSSAFENFKDTVTRKAGLPEKYYFLYRDFQSRNMMIKNNQLYFIDFQSGRKGSFYYDLASFIYSSGTYSYDGMDDELCRLYYDSSGHIKESFEEFRSYLHIFACLRLMQAIGNYAYYYFDRQDETLTIKSGKIINRLIILSDQIGFKISF